jgi:hypothetical protein
MSSSTTSPRNGDANWHGEQDANGVDLSLIRQMLRLSPAERVRKIERHAREVQRLMAYGKQLRQKSA